ncbi:MAG: hypothetical protein ABJG78_20855 [Cyclobacteriaceae bacterium]
MKNISLVVLVLFLSVFIGCSDNSEDTAVDCANSDIAVSVSETTPADCDVQGSIEVNGTGGTSPYSYSIDETTFQNSATFSNLSAGSYTITVKDSDGCTATVEATVSVGPSGITLNLSSSESDCGNETGTISATATGGNSVYTFSLDGGMSQDSGEFDGVSNGSHEVVVTDGEGCSATQSIVVTTAVSWTGDIMPIINSNCAVSGCHNGDNSSIPNWTDLSTVQANASNIKRRTGDKSMPQAGSGLTLTDDEIELIACWVDDGARNN